MPVNFIPSIALCAKWGNIDGDIESQSDLNNKFSQKADTAHNHNSQYEPKNSNTISDTINNDNKLSFVSNHTIVITLNSIISNNNNLYSDYFIGIDEGFEYKLILINSNLASTFTMNSNVINNVASNSFNLPANKSVEISIIKIANKLRYMFSNEMGV
jgi:ribosomal protein L6P/L9E